MLAALAAGCVEMAFVMMDWNSLAKGFYLNLGAQDLTQSEERHCMKLDRDALQRLAQRGKHSTGPQHLIQAVAVNQCGISSVQVCDFVCDCWDCSDENQCGYHKVSPILEIPFTCDFEGSTCGWKDVSTSAYKWIPAQATISTEGTEIPFDHTLGTDMGWYMTTSKERGKPSLTARLASPQMREAAATCEIRAWYHLWGPGLNETHRPSLTMELMHANGTVILWQSPPSSAHAWRELVAYTGRVPGMFQIIFSSTQAFSETVVVALDDVEFRNCGPPHHKTCEVDCQQGGCVGLDWVCDGTEDCRDGTDEKVCDTVSLCSFETGWCDWVPEDNKTLHWARNSTLNMAQPPTFPTRDHSTNSQEGNFAFVSNNPQNPEGGTAWLISPTLETKDKNPCTLVLYIYLYNSDTNRLNIYYRTNSSMQLVKSRSGELGNYWFREQVVFSVQETFQIVIEGVIGTGQPGSIALDDLILPQNCIKEAPSFVPFTPELETPSPCSVDQFLCDNKICISVEQTCDFKVDCADSSDEEHCGMTVFSEDTRGWTDVSVGHLEWSVQRNITRADSVGYSFGLQEAPGQMFSLARAITPALGPSGLACAVEIDFTIGPQGFLALGVTDKNLRTRQTLWSALGNGTTVQAQVTVPLGAKGRPFQLELLGLENLKETNNSLLAIRKIKFAQCNSSQALSTGMSCNFETDWCNWFIEQRDGFEWERLEGADHTTGKGYFLLVDPSVRSSLGFRARLASNPQTLPAEGLCLSFWYRMEGPQIGTLNLKVKPSGEPEHILWTRTGSHGAVWHRGFSNISSQPAQNYQVIFEVLRDGFLGTVALDDITTTHGGCSAQKHCSFETNDCGVLSSGQHPWIRQTGTEGQGPLTDHTLGTPKGHYMILNCSVETLPLGQKATLQSSPFPPLLHTHCVMFWYYLSISDPGSLTVYVEQRGTQSKMLSISTMQGEGWRFSNFSVQVQDEWQVVFEVKGAGGGLTSYTAVDDLHVMEGACPKSGSCDFESGMCGWSKPHGDWYSWDWKEGVTSLRSPSPKEDHTLETEAGHYAYVDTGALGMGRSAARLMSEHLPATTGSCLQFYYHMNFMEENSQAQLEVKLFSLQGERTVWSATGHQGRTWMNQTLSVSSLTEFQIVLEATSGAWPTSSTIAVDDVSYTASSNCSPIQNREQEKGNSKTSVAGLAAGIVCSIVLVVLGAIGASSCRKKWRTPRGGRIEESASIQSFDNMTFREDVFIIPRFPEDEEIQ
ncbi:apical endosomal glycoprotein [Sphaerodactylus townsendi]|uniref:apical endosomal glycoprotein n=1 Tax=Sphaerodactylus townsendi TaxID=933632 RepID=UPI0020265F46|nr:apical endosomal glycoprotein [Sphaerodactylus townsendi]